MYDLNLKIKNLDFEDDMVAAAFLSNLKYFFSEIGIEPSTIIGEFEKFPSVTCNINSLKEFKELFSDYSEEEIKSSKFNWHEVSKYQLSEDILYKYKEYIKWDILIEEYKNGNVEYSKNILAKYKSYINDTDAFKEEINSVIRPIPIVLSSTTPFDTYKKYMHELRKYSSYIDCINSNDDIDYVVSGLNNILTKIVVIHSNENITEEQWLSQSIDYIDFKIIIQFCMENNILSYDDTVINVSNILDMDEYNNLIVEYMNMDGDDIIECIKYKYDKDDVEDYEEEFNAGEVVNFIKSSKELDEDTFTKLKYIVSHMNESESDKFESILGEDLELYDKFVKIFSYNTKPVGFDEALDKLVSINYRYMNKEFIISEEDYKELEKVVLSITKSSDIRLISLARLATKSINNKKNIFDYIFDNYNKFDESDKRVADLILETKEKYEPKNNNKPIHVQTITTNNIASIFGNPDMIPSELWRKISNMKLSKEAIIQYKDKLDMKTLISNPIFGKYMASDSIFFDMFIEDAKKYQAKKTDGSSLYRIKLDDLDI